jgi:hypothetical protein
MGSRAMCYHVIQGAESNSKRRVMSWRSVSFTPKVVEVEGMCGAVSCTMCYGAD